MKWSETFEFSRARASTLKFPLRGYALVFLLFLTLFVCLFLMISIHELIYTLALAGGLAVLLSCIFWVSNCWPQGVRISDRGVSSGRDLRPFDEIEIVVVGTMEIKGRTFGTMVVYGVDNTEQLFGLGRNIDPHELVKILKGFGANVQ